MKTIIGMLAIFLISCTAYKPSSESAIKSIDISTEMRQWITITTNRPVTLALRKELRRISGVISVTKPKDEFYKLFIEIEEANSSTTIEQIKNIVNYKKEWWLK